MLTVIIFSICIFIFMIITVLYIYIYSYDLKQAKPWIIIQVISLNIRLIYIWILKSYVFYDNKMLWKEKIQSWVLGASKFNVSTYDSSYFSYNSQEKKLILSIPHKNPCLIIKLSYLQLHTIKHFTEIL